MATESHGLLHVVQRCSSYINRSIQDVKDSYAGYVAKNPEIISQVGERILEVEAHEGL